MSESDIELLQSDVTAKLLSEEYFATVTVVSLRKLVISSDIAASLVYLTEKAGKKGAGVIVGMPTIKLPDPNVPGPQLVVLLPIRVLEQPTINQDATSGTLKTAEQIAVRTLAILHQFQIEGLGALYGDATAIKPVNEIEGVVGYDVLLECTLAQTPLARCGIPTISAFGVTITLTPVDVGDTIFWSTDGSFPGNWFGHSGEQYGGPFTTNIGAVVRWAAYRTGKTGSDVGRALVT